MLRNVDDRTLHTCYLPVFGDVTLRNLLM